jgi:PTS system mannose-specific IIA component
MVTTLVVTLGSLAESLIEASQKIVGRTDAVRHFSVGWDDDSEKAKQHLSDAIDAIDQGHGVLLLTDIFGSTATNIALKFQDREHIEIVTGVNLPMVVKALTLPSGIAVGEAARQLRTQGQKSIYVASELV